MRLLRVGLLTGHNTLPSSVWWWTGGGGGRSAMLLRVGIRKRVLGQAYPDAASIREAQLEALFYLTVSKCQ